MTPFLQAITGLSIPFKKLAPSGTVITIADMRLLLPAGEPFPPDGILQRLSLPEQQTLESLSYQKRRKEWISGRLAAKEAILQLPPCIRTSLSASQLSILPDASGRPRLDAGILPCTVHLSISHSNDYAAAIASLTGQCGIDIQKTVPKIEKVTDKFTSQTELSLFGDTKKLFSLTSIWTAKEAVKKSILHDQPSLFAGITVIGAERTGPESMTLECSVITTGNIRRSIKVCSTSLDDYIISWTVEEANA